MNALNPVRRIRDQVAEPLEERLNVPRREARKRADELLELVGIPRGRGSAYPHELSGGMRQRTMIAMALACDPAVIIGDEPTTALDVMVQAQILELFERLRHELGLSLILITHDLSVIAETCDRVLVMYAGKVAEEGPVGTVFRNPRHPYTSKLLGAFPNIRADRRTLEVIPGQPPDLRDPPKACRFADALPDGPGRLPRGRAARGHAARRRPRRLPPLAGGLRRRHAGVDDRRAANGGGHRRRRRPDGGVRDRRGSGRMTDGRRPHPPRGHRGPLPDPRRLRRWRPAAAGRVVRAVDGIDLDDPARRGPRPRRRVRLGQDDDRPGHLEADAPDRRPGALQRRGRHDCSPGRSAALPDAGSG